MHRIHRSHHGPRLTTAGLLLITWLAGCAPPDAPASPEASVPPDEPAVTASPAPEEQDVDAAGTALVADAQAATELADEFGTCASFDDVEPGTIDAPGDRFVSGEIGFQSVPYVMPNGTDAPNPSLTLGDDALGFPGSPRRVVISGMSLILQLADVAPCLTIHYRNYDGEIRLEVDGDVVYVKTMMDLDGTSLGGASIRVDEVAGGQAGTLTLTAENQAALGSVTIGGAELALYAVCPCGRCIDFDDLLLGTEYPMGSSFVSDGVTIQLRSYFDANMSEITTGAAYVEDGLMAGGSWQELRTRDVVLAPELDYPLEALSLRVGGVLDGLNFYVNDETTPVVLPDLSGDLSALFPGVDIQVDGDPTGTLPLVLHLSGHITYFAIGGQRTFFDDLCPTPFVLELPCVCDPIHADHLVTEAERAKILETALAQLTIVYLDSSADPPGYFGLNDLLNPGSGNDAPPYPTPGYDFGPNPRKVCLSLRETSLRYGPGNAPVWKAGCP